MSILNKAKTILEAGKGKAVIVKGVIVTKVLKGTSWVLGKVGLAKTSILGYSLTNIIGYSLIAVASFKILKTVYSTFRKAEAQ